MSRHATRTHRPLTPILVMALLCISGLVLLLVQDDAASAGLGLLLTALPLLIGLWCVLRANRKARP